MKIKYLLSFIVVMCASLTTTNAQNDDTEKADEYFNRLEYIEAIEEYQDIVDDGDAIPYVYKQLGQAHYNLYNSDKAAANYKKYIAQTDKDVDAEIYYRYAQMLKANSDYEMSNTYMEKFAQKAGNDRRAKEFMANPNYLSDLMNREAKFTAEAMKAINSPQSDFGAYKKGGKLYFVSSRNESRRDYGWNDQPTLDIYAASPKGGNFQNPQVLEGDVNSKFHEGTVSITSDGETMYFTRNDYVDGDYSEDSQGINRLKVFRAKLVNGSWEDVQPLPFNDSQYSIGHAALSNDDKTLYFSSDMPGGEGQSDLYKVKIKGDNEYGEPQNLGPQINTEGRESFPFIDNEGNLYFSSDGHMGLGGLDVYYAEKKANGFGDVRNLAQPINSQGDDFSFTYNPDAGEGYVASNRGGASEEEENLADDDIYKVVQIKPMKELNVETEIVNNETDDEIPGAEVVVYDQNETKIAEGVTNANGKTNFELKPEMEYTIQVNADDFESNSVAVGENESGDVSKTIELEPVEKIIQEEEIVLNPIMFDFDKADIRKEAAFELDKVVKVMKKHPDMKVNIRSHTDKRGSAKYNKQLSERRAKSTMNYIVENGIDEDRLTSEGVGEAEPEVECGGNCTQEQYETNRRSEFKIVER